MEEFEEKMVAGEPYIEVEKYVSYHTDPLILLDDVENCYVSKLKDIQFTMKILSKALKELEKEVFLLDREHERGDKISRDVLSEIEWETNEKGEKVIKGKNTKKKFTGIPK